MQGGREEAVEGGVGVDGVSERGEGAWARERGDASGLVLGGAFEGVEDAGDLGGVEEREELSDGEIVARRELGEWEVGAEVVVEEGVASARVDGWGAGVPCCFVGGVGVFGPDERCDAVVVHGSLRPQ